MTPTVTSKTQATLQCTPSHRPTAPLRITASTAATTLPGTSSGRVGVIEVTAAPRGEEMLFVDRCCAITYSMVDEAAKMSIGESAKPAQSSAAA